MESIIDKECKHSLPQCKLWLSFSHRQDVGEDRMYYPCLASCSSHIKMDLSICSALFWWLLQLSAEYDLGQLQSYFKKYSMGKINHFFPKTYLPLKSLELEKDNIFIDSSKVSYTVFWWYQTPFFHLRSPRSTSTSPTLPNFNFLFFFFKLAHGV